MLLGVSAFDIALSIALGIGLATAVGFRVFLPMLVMSIAAWSGYLKLSDSFVWLGSLPAMMMLGAAAVAEVLAYYVPAIDHLLDAVAMPIALLAGTLVTAAVITDLPPGAKWATAVIVGASAAGMTKGATALLRTKSLALTGGLGNPAVATVETGGAAVVSVVALIAPLIALAMALVIGGFAVRALRKLLRKRNDAATRESPPQRLPH